MNARRWIVREVRPGLWQARLTSPSGLVFATGEAPWPRVRHFLQRGANGWPVILCNLEGREWRA